MQRFAYSYYYRYFATFYCLSAFKYSQPHLLPFLTIDKLNCWSQDLFRLQSSKDLNYLIFLFAIGFQKTPFSIKTVGQGKKSKVFIQTEFSQQRQIFGFLERYLLLTYPYYHVEPIKTKNFSNDQLTLTFRGFRLPETTNFKPGDYLAENLYDFSLFFQYAIGLTPFGKKSLYEQRFLLRLLNFPLNNS
jgi:hypothetical protein